MEKRILLGTTVIAVLAVSASWVSAKDEVPAAPAAPATTQPTEDKPAIPVELAGIHNSFLMGRSIYSGSCPEGEEGFRSLVQIGIKTIISVDGSKPVMEWAKKYGMRYVHIPVPYSGITRQEQLAIGRAVRDLPGPVFIHCHHGKHRGPTAAVIAAMINEGWTTTQALAAMKQAGTAPTYTGLWADARDFKQPTKEELDNADHSFPEAAKLPPTAAIMVGVDERFDVMGQIKAADWSAPADHPDIDPEHEALQLAEAFQGLKKSPEAAAYPADYLKKMDDAEQAARALQDALHGKDKAKAAEAYVALGKSCDSCHAVYRNPKLPE